MKLDCKKPCDQFDVVIDGDEIEVFKNGSRVTIFVDCFDWMYGTKRIEKLFAALEINNIKVIER